MAWSHANKVTRWRGSAKCQATHDAWEVATRRSSGPGLAFERGRGIRPSKRNLRKREECGARPGAYRSAMKRVKAREQETRYRWRAAAHATPIRRGEQRRQSDARDARRKGSGPSRKSPSGAREQGTDTGGAPVCEGRVMEWGKAVRQVGYRARGGEGKGGPDFAPRTGPHFVTFASLLA